jgi:predicted nucleic acid-binding protein
MKKILIDINIVLDLLNKRQEHEAAAKIFDLCERRKLKGFICSHEITTLSYFMEKYKYPKDRRVFIITKLLDIFSTIPATEKILRNALYSGINDYEDAVIEASALSEEVEFIVTRNIKDFKKGEVDCFSAKEALVVLEE